QEKGIELAPVSAFAATVGGGVRGIVDEHEVFVGSPRHLEQVHLPVPAATERAEALRAGGETVLFAAVDGRLAGLLAVADPPKPSALAALADLRGEGIDVAMVTGDSRTTALAIASKLGIERVDAEVRPV